MFTGERGHYKLWLGSKTEGSEALFSIFMGARLPISVVIQVPLIPGPSGLCIPGPVFPSLMAVYLFKAVWGSLVGFRHKFFKLTKEGAFRMYRVKVTTFYVLHFRFIYIYF